MFRRYSVQTVLIITVFASTAHAEHRSALTNKALTELANRYVKDWDVADAKALASAYMPNGDLITPDGTRLRGHQAIQDFYAAAFASGYAGSHSGFVLKGLRLVAPSVAVLDGTWFIEDAHTSAGMPRAREQGIAAMVVVRSGAAWRIAALREQESASSIKP
jgi:uncharacterized protein (TIGR02246 family)